MKNITKQFIGLFYRSGVKKIVGAGSACPKTSTQMHSGGQTPPLQRSKYPQRANVGAYRIRPANIHVDKWVHSGVCDTPLQLIWQNADIHIIILS